MVLKIGLPVSNFTTEITESMLNWSHWTS